MSRFCSGIVGVEFCLGCELRFAFVTYAWGLF